MASELDNLPDEEIPRYPSGDEHWVWISALKAEIREHVASIIKDVPKKEMVWLAAYLDSDGPAFGKAEAAVKIAFKSKSGYYSRDLVWQTAQHMLIKFNPVIRAWLNEAGYTAEVIKMKTRGMFEAKKTITASDKGKITDTLEVDDNASILKALELASKHQGMMKEKEPGDTKVTVEIINYSDKARVKNAVDTDTP